MINNIRHSIAQQVVETVKDLCNHDINYINSNGIIFASTNPQRLNSYHEIGKRVIESNTTIEVASDHSFHGTLKGVNIPFEYNGRVIAAIGISGEPEEVRKYAHLAKKITHIILHEQEIDTEKNNHRAQKNHIISSLINSDPLDSEYLQDYISEYDLTFQSQCRTVIVELNSRFNLTNLSLIETQIKQTFNQAFSPLYTFHYPNEYIVIMEAKKWQNYGYMFRILAEKYPEILNIGVGYPYPLIRQDKSYKTSKISINSLAGDESIAIFDNLDLEILIETTPKDASEHYSKKVLHNLTEKDIELLRTYFECNMSLKSTSEKLFTHKNTIQYQLDKIYKISSYNPRILSDAVILYLALKLKK